MSPTVRDAVWLTRMLGIRYLWIDSLCILQDSADDWERESARMADIYSFSTISICPLRNIHRPITDGILAVHAWASVRVLNEGHTILTLQPSVADPGHEIRYSAIEERAWILQELILPAMVLFVGQQLILDCAESRRTQSTGFAADAHPGFRSTQILFDDQETTNGTSLLYWYNLIERYTNKALTVATDRLVAIAGVAARLPVLAGNDYVQGLFTQDLHRGLLWNRSGYSTLKAIRKGASPDSADEDTVYTRGGPSWLWVTVSGAVEWQYSCCTESSESMTAVNWLTWRNASTSVSLLKIDEASTVLEGTPVYGKFICDTLRTKPSFQPLSMHESQSGWPCVTDGQITENESLDRDCLGLVASSWVDPRQYDDQAGTVTFLLLLSHVKCSTSAMGKHPVMDTLRRIGVCWAQKEAVDRFAETSEKIRVCVD